MGFTNVYNIGGFFANPGLRYVFPTENMPEPEPEPVVDVVTEPTPVAEEAVEAPAVVPQPPAVAVDGLYTVSAGDSLYMIARNLLGSGSRWGEIYELNSELIVDPRIIQIGWQLRIPA